MMTNFEKNRPQFNMWLTLIVHKDMIVMMKIINIAIDVTILYTSETVIQSKSLVFYSQCIPLATQSMKNGHYLKKINAPNNIITNAEYITKYIVFMNVVLPRSLYNVQNSYLQQHWRQQQMLFVTMQFIFFCYPFFYLKVCL